MSNIAKTKSSILDRPISKAKGDINLSTFALLLSEMVQYTQKRVTNSIDFQIKLADFGRHIGVRVLDLLFLREKKDKREIKFLDQLNFIKKVVWKSIYGKELDSIEKNATDALLYYIVEKEPIINKYVPKDKCEFNLAYLNVGIIDAILNESNFKCKVDLINGENCVYYSITFDKSVIMREKSN